MRWLSAQLCKSSIDCSCSNRIFTSTKYEIRDSLPRLITTRIWAHDFPPYSLRKKLGDTINGCLRPCLSVSEKEKMIACAVLCYQTIHVDSINISIELVSQFVHHLTPTFNRWHWRQMKYFGGCRTVRRCMRRKRYARHVYLSTLSAFHLQYCVIGSSTEMGRLDGRDGTA